MWINDDDDEPDKIPTHHLGFCPFGFILHTMMTMTIINLVKITMVMILIIVKPFIMTNH